MKRRSVVLDNFSPGKTQQHMLNDCNINAIMDRYIKKRIVPDIKPGAFYGDFSEINDFQTAMEKVRNIESHFMSLSAKVRERFKNDPSELCTFILDDKNREEAIELGLIEKPKIVNRKLDGNADRGDSVPNNSEPE